MSQKHKQLLHAKLDKLQETYQGLKKLQSLSLSQLEDEYDKLWVVGFGFVVAIEAIIDIGQEILTEINTKAESYNQVLLKLKEHKIITKEFFERTKGITAFRNRLIHAYPSLDIELVYDNLQNRVGDFKEFIGFVIKYLEDAKD